MKLIILFRKFYKLLLTLYLVFSFFIQSNLLIYAATFTPGIAKRATSTFSVSPMAQGKWATSLNPDFISTPYPSTISGYFRNIYDAYQGTIVVWVTPEWNGNDSLNHDIYEEQSYGDFYLRKTSGNVLSLTVGGRSVSVSITSWVAGTTYFIVGRWSKSPIDGVNYLSISINDSHTFGVTSAPNIGSVGPFALNGDVYGGYRSFQGIIQGLTFYRRVLYDGTYGTDIGNGDEIAKIYDSDENPANGITPQDPTLITGSWDVVFAMPTNSSTGKLSSGTGEAWSHPHSSNVLYTSTTNTGGFMMNGTYTNDGWADEGSPTNLSSLASAEKIYPGGYKWTNDAVNEGIKYTKSSLTAGQNYVIRTFAHSDGTAIPKIQIWDATNGAEITQMTANDATATLASPEVFLFTFELPTTARNGVASNCTSIEVRLLNTEASGTIYWHQVELLQNLVDNPSLETGAIADPWIPDGWSNYALDAGDIEKNITAQHSGASCLQANVGAGIATTPYEMIYFSNPLARGKFGDFGYWLSGSGSSSTVGSWHSFYLQASTSLVDYFPTNNGTWTNYLAAIRSNWGGDWVTITFKSGGPTARYVDDIYYFALTDVSLTVIPASEVNSTENSDEIRVDGRDTYISSSAEAVSFVADSGYVSFNWRPRHSAANAVNFAETTDDDAYIASFYGDADDYIKVYWDSANTVKMEYSMAGSTGSGTWDATGAIDANTEYSNSLTFTDGGNMVLNIGGTDRITLSSIPSTFGTAPNTIYWGSDTSGANQGDATFSNFVFDNTAPSISLTALSPDPNSDSTPSVTGTATDSLGIIGTVEHQMDGTNGSWTSCTADDGTFDEASEAFICTVSTVLSDGSHTIYVRATDSNSNTTTSGSESSDSFTIDAVNPTAFSLLFPGNEHYTNSSVVEFEFSPSSDATSGLKSYTFTLNNHRGGEFSFTSIPTDGGSDYYYEHADYEVWYSNWSDPDLSDRRIKLRFKSSFTKSIEINGINTQIWPLEEGKHSWSITAYDNLDQQITQSHILNIDKTSPSLSEAAIHFVDSVTERTNPGFSLISGSSYQTNFAYWAFSGKLEDEYQSKTRINPTSSGPYKIDLEIKKKDLFLGFIEQWNVYFSDSTSSLFEQLDNYYLSSPNKTARFYLPIVSQLPIGEYQVTLKVKDFAGNSSSYIYYLNLKTVREVARQLVEQEIEEGKTTNQEKDDRLKQIIEQLQKQPQLFKEQFQPASILFKFINRTIGLLGRYIAFSQSQNQKFMAKTYDLLVGYYRYSLKTYRQVQLALVRGLGSIYKLAAINIKLPKIGKLHLELASISILAKLEPISQNIVAVSKLVSSDWNNFKVDLLSYYRLTKNKVELTYVIWFIDQPTQISNVKVKERGSDYVIITWQTNHPANSKVSYGETLDYGNDIQSSELVKNHEVKIADLQPGTDYFYEVMSQGKSYVFDAAHSFRTVD